MALHAAARRVMLSALVCIVNAAPLSSFSSPVNVLVVYSSDQFDQNKAVAERIAAGASASGATVKTLEVAAANYKRDVFEFADAVIIGSGVYNGNTDPQILSFINTFDFMDDLSSKVGASFSTGGGAAAGLQPVLEQIDRGLQTFRFIVVGGTSWMNSEGTGVLTGSANWSMPETTSALAFAEGGRVVKVAAALKASTPPTPNTTNTTGPPGWGDTWKAQVSANLTQVGYDAGLVIVNFTAQCQSDPSQQKMRTVYGDFYTVLTLCNLKKEFTIAPASRGGGCTSRTIGIDVSDRICKACGCPFCVRDTNGTFSHGEDAASSTVWNAAEKRVVAGESVNVWTGRASSQGSESAFDLETTVAYNADGKPLFVNVSHPLWVQTAARIDHFTNDIDQNEFTIPDECFK